MKNTIPIGPISGIIFAAHAVYTTENEFGKRGSLVGVYTDLSEAKKVNATAGWYDGAGSLEEVYVLEESGRYYLLNTQVVVTAINTNLPLVRTLARKAALAKLTEEEIELLGIKD